MRSKLGMYTGLLLLAVSLTGQAQEATRAEPRAVELGSVVVTGAQPGPGMWKVSKGDHTLWILGTLSPLPRGIEWKADEVRAVLEQADQVLSDPGVAVSADIGLFRGLMLLPSALKIRNNVDGKMLSEVVPPPAYARWAPLKQRYLGRDMDVEKRRPFFAADELYSAALKRSGLGGDPVSPVVNEVMKRRKIKYTSAVLRIELDDPKAAIADFREEQFGDAEIRCFEQTLSALENDLPRIIGYANAWATGDIEELRSMRLADRSDCWKAWADTEAARKRGADDIEARVRAKWLEVANKALDKHRVTFATLPMAELFGADGYLARLRANGYAVEEPL